VRGQTGDLFVNSSGATFLRADLTVLGITEVQSAGPIDDEAGLTEDPQAAAEGDAASRYQPLTAEVGLPGTFAFLEAGFDLANFDLLTILPAPEASETLVASTLEGLVPAPAAPETDSPATEEPLLGGLNLRAGPDDLLVGVQVPGMQVTLLGQTVEVTYAVPAAGSDPGTVFDVPLVWSDGNGSAAFGGGLALREDPGGLSVTPSTEVLAAADSQQGQLVDSLVFQLREENGREVSFTVGLATNGVIVRGDTPLAARVLEDNASVVAALAVAHLRAQTGLPLRDIRAIYLETPAAAGGAPLVWRDEAL